MLADPETSSRIRNKNALLHVVKLIFAACSTGVFAAAWAGFYAELIYRPFYGRGNIAVVGLYFVLFVTLCRLYGGFQVGLVRISELVYSQGVALMMTGGLIYIVIWLLTRHLPDPMPLLGATAINFMLGILWSRLANRLNNRLFPPKRTLVVYEGEQALAPLEGIAAMHWKFCVVDTVQIGCGVEAVLQAIQAEAAEAVFVCGVTSSVRNIILKECLGRGVQVYLRPKLGDLLVSSAKRVQMFNVPILYCARSNASMWYLAAKRTLDLCAALAALALLWPLMALTALAIKLYDKGPVFYKQCRLTKDGKRFNILKFRSMRPDAEKDGVARLASENDDRITPIGRLIRMIRFDELPQLFNILKGDMSLVGPRPERPEIAARYAQQMPEFNLRLQVKAGLTGYAQVHGRYNSTPYDKLQMDLMYIADQSMANDLKIMMMTVKILFMPESTEGVREGKTTAVRWEPMEGGQAAATAKEESMARQ